MISFDTLLAVTSGGLVLGAMYALMAAGLAGLLIVQRRRRGLR